MRNDNEIVYRQNMTRNEAVHILKAIDLSIIGRYVGCWCFSRAFNA